MIVQFWLFHVKAELISVKNVIKPYDAHFATSPSDFKKYTDDVAFTSS